MVATDIQVQDQSQAGERGSTSSATRRNQKSNCDATQRLAKGLGWFSIGLGLAEVLTPRGVSALIGIRDDKKTRRTLRNYGVREIGAGIAILAQPTAARWLWGRVAGDAVDLSSLAAAFQSKRNDKGKLAFATASVAGVTALDVICAQRLSRGEQTQDPQNQRQKKETKATKVVTVDRSPEEAYNFWRNFDNLPKFMTYLESVRSTGDRKSHWIANGPVGSKIEWDAELVKDEPNRLISWRSTSGMFANAGTVRFEPAPGGRGTIVRVEMDYAPNGGVLNSAVGRMMGTDIGQRILHDLRNFKQMLEIGEVTQSDASIHSGMHPAQPPAQGKETK